MVILKFLVGAIATDVPGQNRSFLPMYGVQPKSRDMRAISLRNSGEI